MVKLTLTAWSWANSPSCNNPETTFSVGKKATVTLPSTSGDTPWKEKKDINTNCQTTLFFYLKINLWFLFKNYSTLLNFVNVKIKASTAIYSSKTSWTILSQLYNYKFKLIKFRFNCWIKVWDCTYIVCCLHSGDYQKDSFKNKYRSDHNNAEWIHLHL